jgi:hypothetical protein
VTAVYSAHLALSSVRPDRLEVHAVHRSPSTTNSAVKIALSCQRYSSRSQKCHQGFGATASWVLASIFINPSEAAKREISLSQGFLRENEV